MLVCTELTSETSKACADLPVNKKMCVSSLIPNSFCGMLKCTQEDFLKWFKLY